MSSDCQVLLVKHFEYNAHKMPFFKKVEKEEKKVSVNIFHADVQQ